ncbi:MAG: galactokinase [Bacteroidetes bacterium]|nr:MAG: galactokinase [Bacteroidota bacterium]
MELIRDTISRFKQIFYSEPDLVVTAPGRVNLLGEHTDYNEGFVLPVAIDKQIILAIGSRDDEEVHLHAIDLMRSVRTSLNSLSKNPECFWSNYPLGVFAMLRAIGAPLRGANICYRGTIPLGAGLSSSAAIEVACATALTRLYDIPISQFDLIKLAWRSEVEFVGVNCGIMDQFVSVMGKKNHAVFLDCRDFHHEYIPCPKGLRLVVCDTGVRRELAYSNYNLRRQECQEAVSHFAKKNPAIRALRDVTVEEFASEERSMDPVIRNRSRHIIMENMRVLRGIRALQQGEVVEFGKFMIDSHMSLRDYYEVSCPELDAFVDIAVESEGVYGARMTGAGFGGCGICIVREDCVDQLVERLRHEYPISAGRSLTIYLASVEHGATTYDLRDAGMTELLVT